MIFASDLDRTLIHPLRTLPFGRADDVQIVEVYEGRAITCASHKTIALLARLAKTNAFVPVTTRSRAQLARLRAIVELSSGWAVCANGGTVLRDGVPDRDWAATVAETLASCASLREVGVAVAAAVGGAGEDSWRLRERDCDGLFLYSVCAPDRIPDGAQAATHAAVSPLGWTAHLHGRKLYVLPASLSKSRAVEHVREQLADDGPLVAAGDSELDRCLLEAADAGHCPRDSELALSAHPLPRGIRLTDSEHVGAAEEIVSWTLSYGDLLPAYF